MPSTPENQGQFEARIAQLTRTQKQVLEMFVQGCDDGAIADSLEIVENTVRQHISRIANKLGIPSDRSDKGFRRREIIKLFRQHAPEQVAEVHYCDEPLSGLDARQPVKSTLDTSTVTEPEIVDQLSNDPNFVGREEAIAELDRLRERGSKLVQIVAAGGQGKTTLARKYLYNRFDHVIEFAIAKETKNVSSVDSLLQEKLRQMGEEPGRELMVSLERFRQKLQSTKVGILIDNLESTLDATGCFIEEHRSYIELMRVLSDSSLRSFSMITSRESLNEPSISLDIHKLRGLSIEAWYEYFKYQLVIAEDQDESLIEMHGAFGGNAKAMDVLSKAIQLDYEGEIRTYWQESRSCLLMDSTLENLIKEQFKRLQKLNLNNSYNLLCRMGCYRYQDISTVSIYGLSKLLWDVNKNEQRKAINLLKDRGLIEFYKNEYFLHPVIREESLRRLKESNEWTKTNDRAALFWTEKIKEVKSITDALNAFEACYHKLNNCDYEGMIEILFCHRRRTGSDHENLKGGINLFDDLRRHGLLLKVEQFKGLFEIKNDQLSLKFQILFCFGMGCLKWFLGNINLAIDDFESRVDIIPNKYKGKIKNYSLEEYTSYREPYLGTLMSLGYCHMHLWDFKKAITYFQEVLNITEESEPEFNYIIEGNITIAFLESYLKNNQTKVLERLNYVFDPRVVDYKNINFYCSTYRYIFGSLAYKNIGNYDKAKTTIKKLIEAFNGEFSSYVYKHVYAFSFTVLAELYRIENRLDLATEKHEQSIQVLEKLGAKCELGEAYFQYGLTCKKSGNIKKAKRYFEKALYLWSPEQINAPKQIERVKKAMNQSL